eukprot:3834469-Pyramimonas_sp.AAC.1
MALAPVPVGPPGNASLKVMEGAIEQHDMSGAAVRLAAKDKGEEFKGNKFCKTSAALSSGI